MVGACTFRLIGPGVSMELGQEGRRLERAKAVRTKKEVRSITRML